MSSPKSRQSHLAKSFKAALNAKYMTSLVMEVRPGRGAWRVRHVVSIVRIADGKIESSFATPWARAAEVSRG